MSEPCSDCPLPATTNAYAGYRRIGNHYIPLTRPLCDHCAHEDARERAEARST